MLLRQIFPRQQTRAIVRGRTKKNGITTRPKKRRAFPKLHVTAVIKKVIM